MQVPVLLLITVFLSKMLNKVIKILGEEPACITSATRKIKHKPPEIRWKQIISKLFPSKSWTNWRTS